MSDVYVGRPHSYRQVHSVKGFGVFQKTPLDGAKASFIIARLLSTKAYNAIPASVSQEFPTT